MRAGLLVVAIAATIAACGGGDDAPDDTARKPKADAAELRFHAVRSRLRIGQATTFSGRLLLEEGRAAGREIRIEADPWPFDRFRAIDTVKTRRYGLFRYRRVRPTRNTRYRAVAEGVGSEEDVVRVWVEPKLRLRVVAAPRVEAAVSVPMPAAVPVRRRLGFYVYENRRRDAWVRVGRGVVHRSGRTLEGATVYASRPRVKVAVCLAGRPSPALGGHWLSEHQCGRRTVDNRYVG